MDIEALWADPNLRIAIIGALIPLVVGFATKLQASGKVKAGLALVLLAVVAVANEYVASGGTLQVGDLVSQFIYALTGHTIAYQTIWRPIGGGVAPTARIAPDLGIGAPVRPIEQAAIKLEAT